ncbi:hypothetical protein MAPG_05201 [Magnaporthiopsis poae ATCC 64411]|uniref:Uncharacterized protein n=1 Tax=Magnaporthiopsis poae (strain ATCC 64411 / 73-15) TaxID=644358 RepID=A0A0C4DYS4_MAGP6|nr:hypothetical protein MAPG_05201 [Magnaporthiopsis poae ATCC 64411]
MRPQTRASAEPLGSSSSRLQTPPTTTANITSSSRGRETERRREALLETAVRNRRSLGIDTLRSLVPSETDGTLGGGADFGARRQQQQQQQQPQRDVVRRGSGKVKRESGGRWGWAGWW